MELPQHIAPFWSEFLTKTGLTNDTLPYEVFHFTDNEAGANELAELVLRGDKVATASLLWEYESEGTRLPQPGDLSVVTSWATEPLCVIETTYVEVRPFEAVGDEFAAAEGEGDCSLRYWREVHWDCFGRVCEELGCEPTMRMDVVCERFRVVFGPENC